MKQLSTFILSLFVSLLAGFAGPGFADDTDIYLRQTPDLDDKARPNILFVFDNSGSMLWDIRDPETGEATGERRIDVLRTALLQMLDEIHNVNIGFARFAQINARDIPQYGNKDYPSNAPITFPIFYIDANVNEIEGEIDDTIMDASSRIARSENDAEENVNTQEVSIDEEELEMVQLSTIDEPNGIKVEKEIEDSRDDAGEEGDGNISPAADTITLGQDPDDGAMLAGLRFKALGIPQGARIQKAQIEFVSAETYEADENVAELIAYGALLEDRTDLSAEEIADLSEESFRNNKFLSQNFPGPAEVEAEKATQGVNWRFDEQLAEKQTFKTPDLKSIIQQLVNQQKWQSDSNAILLFKPAATNEGGRRFYSYDSFNPPILTVYWTPADGKVSLLAEPIDDRTYSNQRIEYKNRNGDLKSSTETIFLGDNWDDNTAGLRFFPVGIPSNAEIKEAKIIFTHQSDSDKVEAANEEPLELNIYGEKNSSEPFNRDIGFSSRIPTEHAESWSHTETPQAGASFSSPDLSEIVKEIIAQPGWQAGEGMAFFFEEQSGNNGYRRIVGADDIVNTDKTNLEAREVEIVPDETTLARLEITYSAGEAGEETAENDTQLIGLRFENIDIPTYAKVKAASIEFTSAQANTEPATLIIQGEKLNTSADPASAAEFAEEEANISQREHTDAQVTWDVDPWYGGNLKYTSPDLTAVVQEIVNHSGWCGGRDAMAFIISGEGEAPLRIAQSYDGDPRNAPVLTVEFDSQEQDISGDACVQQNFSGRISSENNDAEEIVGGSEDSLVYLKTPTLELGTHQDKNLVGLRFTDVPVGSQAKIEKAELIFTSVKNDSNKTMRPADLTISGEKSLNAAAFSDSDGDLSQRAKTQNVSWVINEEWENGKLYQSVDISPVVQEIIQQSGWEAYSSMAFFITGTGLRRAISFRSDPSEAPVLRIQVQGYLGEDGQGSFMTVRRRLKRITKNMEIPGGGWTPIVDGLYEAALYYRGQRVDYGKTRHDQSIYLVSHPGTYDGGVLDRPEACSIVKPYAEECAAEKITGAPDYISPITTPCQTNHIVFLTDGDATTISAADKVRNLVGKMDCYSEYEDPDEDSDEMVAVTQHQSCGLDLAEFLNTTDNNTEVAEPQNIQVHAIGFQLGKGWKRLRVEKTDENGNVIYEIDPITGNHLRDKNGDKIPVMVPAGWIEDEKETEDNERAVKFLKTLAKKGGGNFYAADSAEQLIEAFKSIVSEAMTTSTSFAAPSVSVNLFNDAFHRNEVYYALFKPDQHQRWAGNVKRFKVCSVKDSGCEPGALIDVNGHSAVEGNYISPEARSAWTSDEHAPDGSDVMKGAAGEQVPPSAERVIYTYLGDSSTGSNHNITLGTDQRIENYISDQGFQEALFEGGASEEEVSTLVNWIKGQDVMDEDNDSDIDEDRWRMADPLHSSPNVVTYGGTEAAPIMKLFVGTNDGLIRMIDATDGQEEWAFLPQEMLPIQEDLMENAVGERIYGIDGTPTLLVYSPSDGVITGNDFVWLYMSMRRGGNNIYALDVTNEERPKLMWTLKGGEPGTDYARLGQTWSRPKVSIANFKGKKYVVLLFGGGYHDSADRRWGSTNEEDGGGNAIYMVDAHTGERLWWASSDPGADLVLDDMVYPIPSELKLVDIDADSITDRIYVGDLGGQVWRIDLGDLGGANPGRGAKIANVNPDVGKENDSTPRRRFFYPPEVTRMKLCSEYASAPEYYLVGIVSGNRPAPLSNEVLDKVYAFHDTYTGYLPVNEGGAVTFETINPDRDMVDLTSNVLQLEPNSPEAQQTKAELQQSKGWYIDLEEQDGMLSGEKGLASALIIEDRMYFTTYSPPEEQENLCGFSEGRSRLYHINTCMATALEEEGLDDEEGSEEGEAGEEAEPASRSTEIKSGITSDIIPRFDDDGVIRGTTNDPSLNQSLGTTKAQQRFWQQQ